MLGLYLAVCKVYGQYIYFSCIFITDLILHELQIQRLDSIICFNGY